MNTQRSGRTKRAHAHKAGFRTFDQLTGTEQAEAVNIATCELLAAIRDGLRFNDSLNHDDLQARIDAAQAEAEAMQTPWFAYEYIMDTCREDIEGMARCDAEDAYYPDTRLRLIRLAS